MTKTTSCLGLSLATMALSVNAIAQYGDVQISTRDHLFDPLGGIQIALEQPGGVGLLTSSDADGVTGTFSIDYTQPTTLTLRESSSRGGTVLGMRTSLDFGDIPTGPTITHVYTCQPVAPSYLLGTSQIPTSENADLWTISSGAAPGSFNAEIGYMGMPDTIEGYSNYYGVGLSEEYSTCLVIIATARTSLGSGIHLRLETDLAQYSSDPGITTAHVALTGATVGLSSLTATLEGFDAQDQSAFILLQGDLAPGHNLILLRDESNPPVEGPIDYLISPVQVAGSPLPHPSGSCFAPPPEGAIPQGFCIPGTAQGSSSCPDPQELESSYAVMISWKSKYTICGNSGDSGDTCVELRWRFSFSPAIKIPFKIGPFDFELELPISFTAPKQEWCPSFTDGACGLGQCKTMYRAVVRNIRNWRIFYQFLFFGDCESKTVQTVCDDEVFAIETCDICPSEN